MIGLFDSGIGGLTVVRELLRQVPDASLIYLGDTARSPYGNKSPATVTRYSLEIVKFLLAQGATRIVIACNSASAVATEALRSHYPTVPIYEVITPAVDDALAATKGRVGVIGTRATISSGIYEQRLLRVRKLFISTQACPLLVPLVEEGWLKDGETKRIVRHYLSAIRSVQVDTMILGCTHYPLLTPIIKRYMGNKVKLIDSGISVVGRLLAMERIEKTSMRKYFLTDVSSRSTKIAKEWLGTVVGFEKADIS